MPYPKTPEGRKRNSEYQRKWYLRNKKLQQERSEVQKVKNRKRNQKIVLAQLLSGCVDCGIEDLVVLEFDHVRGEKKALISCLVARPSSVKDLTEELDKCEVVCANCHRKRTATRNGTWWKLSAMGLLD